MDYTCVICIWQCLQHVIITTNGSIRNEPDQSRMIITFEIIKRNHVLTHKNMGFFLEYWGQLYKTLNYNLTSHRVVNI